MGSIDLEVWSATRFDSWADSIHPTLGICYPAIKHHLPLFADDSQLHDSAAPSDFPNLVRDIASCIEEVKVWIKGNKLKLNMSNDKTELISTGSNSKLK